MDGPQCGRERNWTVLSKTGRSRTRVEVFLANGDGYGSEQMVSGQNSPNQSNCKSGRSKSVNVKGWKVQFNNITTSYVAIHFESFGQSSLTLMDRPL